jgi:hypothetical protein
MVLISKEITKLRIKVEYIYVDNLYVLVCMVKQAVQGGRDRTSAAKE